MKILVFYLLAVFFFFDILVLDVCSKNLGQRIIGGRDAFEGEYPYLAAINVTTATSKFFCGGSLISNEWILTAGRCVDGAVLFTCQLGSVKLVGEDSNRKTVATSEYVIHPDYNPLTLENDLGLIKLRMPVEYSFYLKNNEFFLFGIFEVRDTWVIGWGQINDEAAGFHNDLQVAEVAPLTNEECRLYYGNQINENTVCVVGNYNEGSCYGDTGTPLVVDMGRGYRAIAGVASFISGNGCESTDPSGYTRTYPYEDWLRNVTGL